jgi:hypothetical protein
MIDVVLCIKRRQDVTLEEFHRYWREDHARLVARHAATIGAVSYVQHHTIDTGLESIVQGGRGCPPDVYDGIAVVSFESLDDMASKGARTEALASAEELAEDELRFIDHSASRIWFTEHLTIV